MDFKKYFSDTAPFGDLVTAILAFAAIPFVLRSSRLAKSAVWAFNIFGTLDLLAAITFATIYNAPVTMGPAYWIPAFWPLFFLVAVGSVESLQLLLASP